MAQQCMNCYGSSSALSQASHLRCSQDRPLRLPSWRSPCRAAAVGGRQSVGLVCYSSETAALKRGLVAGGQTPQRLLWPNRSIALIHSDNERNKGSHVRGS